MLDKDFKWPLGGHKPLALGLEHLRYSQRSDPEELAGSATLRDRIEYAAQQVGFEAVGILRRQDWEAGVYAAEYEMAKTDLMAWLEKAFHGEMHWMANHLEKRFDPFSLLTAKQNDLDSRLRANTLVVVAQNYFVPDISPETNLTHPPPFKIARYALGDDYHQVMKDKLYQLLNTLEQNLTPVEQATLPEGKLIGRALVDSAPVMERTLAVLSGMGWIGKNGNVLLPQRGSWFFLGVLLLNLELEEVEQPPLKAMMQSNHCGTCTRCMEACPTEAIVADGVVDATKCIAYWTIESDAPAFPSEIKENLNGWVFGCDICQEVCPWNIKFAKPTEEKAFAPYPEHATFTAETWLEMTESTFKQRYQQSTMLRTGLCNLQRNLKATTSNHPASCRTPRGHC